MTVNLITTGRILSPMADSPSTASTETDEPDTDAIAILTADLFDEDPLLDLDAYLDLFEEIAERPRFAILYALKTEGKLSANELSEALDRRENSLHYHLNRLVEAGLVENRKQERPDVDGLYSYYELTGLGADLIDAATEFIGQEKTALEQY